MLLFMSCMTLSPFQVPMRVLLYTLSLPAARPALTKLVLRCQICYRAAVPVRENNWVNVNSNRSSAERPSL